MFKLPSINNIEVYILARNMTGIEEYTLVTFSDNIIDSIKIGSVGSISDYDRKFYIGDNYKNIEIYSNKGVVKYYISNSGKIISFN